MRKRLWQLHSWFGLIAGLGLLVIGLSGSLLMFRLELERAINPEIVNVTPTAAGRLPLDDLLAAAERQLPGYEVTGWLLQHDDPHTADLLYTIRHGTNEWLVATLDPYTGQLLANPRAGTRTVWGWLLELHYTFFADHAGMVVTATFGLLLCLLGITGVWIYREFWKHLFTLRWGRGARIFCSDLHKAVGISSVAFNLLLGFTGAYWNVAHIVAEWGHEEEPPLAGRVYPPERSLDALVRDAAARLPGFQTNFVSLPWEPNGGFTLWGAVEPRGVLRGPYGSTAAYDNAGQFVALDDLRQASAWRQIVDAFVPLHYGTFGGWPVKLLWTVGGLTPGVLAVSGFLIWRSRRRRTPQPAGTTSASAVTRASRPEAPVSRTSRR